MMGGTSGARFPGVCPHSDADPRRSSPPPVAWPGAGSVSLAREASGGPPFIPIHHDLVPVKHYHCHFMNGGSHCGGERSLGVVTANPRLPIQEREF